jgi:hypothetical protein
MMGLVLPAGLTRNRPDLGVMLGLCRPDRQGHVVHATGRDGIVAAIQTLRATRAGAIKARTAAINQLKGCW